MPNRVHLNREVAAANAASKQWLALAGLSGKAFIDSFLEANPAAVLHVELFCRKRLWEADHASSGQKVDRFSRGRTTLSKVEPSFNAPLYSTLFGDSVSQDELWACHKSDVTFFDVLNEYVLALRGDQNIRDAMDRRKDAYRKLVVSRHQFFGNRCAGAELVQRIKQIAKAKSQSQVPPFSLFDTGFGCYQYLAGGVPASPGQRVADGDFVIVEQISHVGGAQVTLMLFPWGPD